MMNFRIHSLGRHMVGAGKVAILSIKCNLKNENMMNVEIDDP